jgi:hypothetical protein
MLTRSRTRLRLIAALLAWAGMLALPLRTLAACPMLEASPGAAVMHHAVPVADVAEYDENDEHAGHDGHDMARMHAESPEAPTSQDAPAHETCPDLAHCAVAAVPTPLAIAVAPTAPAAALRVAPQAAPLSVVHALEPPPPKA